MKVSVVIPTRNRRTLLAMTLSSVLAQRGVDFEVIVVDEASTDDTHAMLAALGSRAVRVVRHGVPLGVAAARNRGVAEATGEWVAFLDDDDLWAPDKLARQVTAARTAGREWAYSGSVNIDGRCQVVFGRPPLPPDAVMAALPRYNPIPAGASNVVVRRETLLGAGPFDSGLRNTEDWEMWMRLAQVGPPAWVCSPLTAYRMHVATSSLNVGEIVRGVRTIETRHATQADWGRWWRWIAQLSVRNGQRGQALRYYGLAALHGQAREAASDLAGLARRTTRRRLGLQAAAPPARRGDLEWEEQARAWLEALSRGGDMDVQP